MRIGLDLDGVLYDFEGALRASLVNTGKRTTEQCPPAQTWGFYGEWGLTRDEFMAWVSYAVDYRGLYGFGHYAPDIAALNRLTRDGHTLHVATARFGGQPGVLEQLTAAWCRRHLPPLDSLTFTKDKTTVAVEVFLEDNLRNYDALTTAGVAACLINRPWNRDDSVQRTRVDTVTEFVDRVEDGQRQIALLDALHARLGHRVLARHQEALGV